MYPILYKQDSTGSLRQWQMELNNEQYRTISGQVGGQLVTSEWTTATPKNVGASNQRSAAVQAQSEVDSAYKKKQKEGYRRTKEEAATGVRNFFEPMLAKKYEDYIDDLPWAPRAKKSLLAYAQPKLDGIRCLYVNGQLQTRKGEPIPACTHILEALKNVPPDVVLDGELYNHDLKDNFNEIASLVRKTKNISDSDRALIKSTIQYWVYDSFYPKESELLFGERVPRTSGIVHQFTDSRFTREVSTQQIASQAELDRHYEDVLSNGFEGQMVRLNGAYQNKRSINLLKRKEFQDEEFVILDVLEGLGNRSGMAGALLLQLEDGRTFQSGIKGGRDHYRYLLSKRDQFIGKHATIRYFHRTPDGIPRFPVCTDIGRTDA